MEQANVTDNVITTNANPNEVTEEQQLITKTDNGVTQKHAETANLEEKSGIYRMAHEDIDRLYNEITGFMAP